MLSDHPTVPFPSEDFQKSDLADLDGLLVNSENFNQVGSNMIVDLMFYRVIDSDDNFGISPKRRRLTKSPSEPCDSETAKKNNEEDANGSDASSLSLLSGGESEEENQDETGDLPSSDDGVFDVEDETSVSDNQVGVGNDSSVRRQANHRPSGASDSEIDEGSASSSSEQEVVTLFNLRRFITSLADYGLDPTSPSVSLQSGCLKHP
ncbi:unnamed protein product [Dibothriocephalus latus]|uniref:Uncharacterized protein n=1 Tax=Dibothriocephalus latus TaxID=60516 RepID=A0A3P7LLL1_DIBLA|nr:unnamed protein product [Dibothriocephalus latus]